MDNKEKNGRSVGGLRDQMSGSVCSTRRNICIYTYIYTIRRSVQRENVDTNIDRRKKDRVHAKLATHIYVYVASNM